VARWADKAIAVAHSAERNVDERQLRTRLAALDAR